MTIRFSMRGWAVCLGLSASVAMGQSALPPTAPTAAATQAIGTAGPVASGPVTHRAEVEYTGGLLRVAANNSSLNQILREIGRLTGMKITGGVTEDRVFGTYGPASASKVITSLLDGTTTNVVIVENAADGPAELILTPRQGGPTPPNPNASAENDAPAYQSGPPAGVYVPPRPGAMYAQPMQQVVTPPDGSSGTMVNTDNPVTTPVGAPGADGSQPQSPNGVSTPQQIYEQLQKMRQQQQTANPQ